MGSAIFVPFKMTNLLAQNVFYSILAYVMKFNFNFWKIWTKAWKDVIPYINLLFIQASYTN